MVFIIGEIGTNHVGDVNIAKKIIDAAVQAGFDAVKFQKKNVEKIYTSDFLNSYLDSPWGTTQREMRLNREFSDKQFKEIDRYCKKKKIPWFVSCWDVGSQLHMRKFKTKYNKISSAMLIHEKLLKIIAEEKKHTFISTGMSTLKDVEKAVKIFRMSKCPFELLHTNSSYPMKNNEANLNLIPILAKKFKCNVGYSGHETGASLISVAAVMLGAVVIERHITIDRTMYGHDQAASLEPEGMKRLVRDIRTLNEIMGDGKKRIWDSELPNMKKLRQILT
ncbi:N-acetylneuraminate synthase family protein [Nitrosopumilus sp.]|uniref:N-acetylneuraminate synthase family protein n=1 Tax=Nitrosopumilus sp. TaxID=2024843 RepID=UPI003D0BB299